MNIITDQKCYPSPLLIFLLKFIFEHYIRVAQINMENFNINFCRKSIPILSDREYMIQLISKVEKFIKRVRWKSFQLFGKFHNSRQENCGFKSRRCLPCVDELLDFENDMMKMINNIEFRKLKCTFQTKVMSDITKISESNKLLIPADKSISRY